MATVMDRMPVFTYQAGQQIDNSRPNTTGNVAALVNAPGRRGVLAIVTPMFAIDVTVEGVTAALFTDDVWVEPVGWVSMWNADGWLIVSVDSHPDLPDIQLRFSAERLAAVLADIALARCVESVRHAGGAG